MADNAWWFKAQFSWATYFEDLTDEQVGRFCRAIFQYAATGEMPELSGMEKLLFRFAQESLRVEKLHQEKRSEAALAREEKHRVERAQRTAAGKAVENIAAAAGNDAPAAETGEAADSGNKKSPVPVDNVPGQAAEKPSRAEELAVRYGLKPVSAVLDAINEDANQHGWDAVEQAMAEASRADTRNGISVNFYRAILSGRQKPAGGAAHGKTVTEARYTQRSYDDDEDRLPEWMMKALMEQEGVG